MILKKLRDGWNYVRNLGFKKKGKWGYGEIGRCYGFDCIEF